MNRIVRENFPVERLPEELRKGFLPGERVRVSVEESHHVRAQPEPDSRPFRDFYGTAKPRFETPEQADRHLEVLRKEWERR
jgi:hypothetical protein